MKCLDKSQLNKLFSGKLNPQELVLLDEQLSCCETCRQMLHEVPEWRSACANLGAELLSVRDCPDYEMLSAYLDGALNDQQRRSVESHTNLCELCARDVARILELRSHAAIREKIIVRPTTKRRTNALVWLRRAAVTLSATAVVVVTILSLDKMGSPPPSNRGVVKLTAPSSIRPVATKPTPVGTQRPQEPRHSAKATPPSLAPQPASTVILRDGPYRVVKKNGRFIWADSSGVAATRVLEARIAASIELKLKTGRVKPGRPVQIAMDTVRLRSSGNYTPAPTAPSPISPVGTVVLPDRPMLKWSKVDMAHDYRVVITDKTGRPVVDAVTGSNYFTPSSPLPRGQMYIWRVGVRFGEGAEWENSRPSAFEVLSSADYGVIDRVKRQAHGSHLALGVAYEYFGLYDEAAQQYRMLRRQNPSSQLARKLLTETRILGH